VEYCPGIRAQHGVGTAPIRDVAVEVGAVPASPNPLLPIVCRKQTAARHSGARGEPVDMWTTQERCPHTHRQQQQQQEIQKD
jgi:hypothetical protein